MKIIITGQAGEGKSAMASFLGEMLFKYGLNVTVEDEGEKKPFAIAFGQDYNDHWNTMLRLCDESKEVDIVTVQTNREPAGGPQDGIQTSEGRCGDKPVSVKSGCSGDCSGSKEKTNEV